MRKIFTLLLLTPLYSLCQFNPIGDYPFNGNANDISGSGHNGSVNGATVTSDRFGNPNSAYYFDGINDYIDLGTAYTYNSHTFSCWSKKDSTNSNLLISKMNNGPHDVKLSELSNNDFALGNGSGWVQTLTPLFSSYVDSVWNFYVGTYDSTSDTAKLYINGTLAGKTKVNGYVDVSNTPLYVGVRPYWNGTSGPYNYFRGYIDDVKIYNKALTQAQIDTLYNTPNPTLTINEKEAISPAIVHYNKLNKNLVIQNLLPNSNYSIKVFDMTGRILLTAINTSRIDISTLPTGIYISQVIGRNGSVSKFIKE